LGEAETNPFRRMGGFAQQKGETENRGGVGGKNARKKTARPKRRPYIGLP